MANGQGDAHEVFKMKVIQHVSAVHKNGDRVLQQQRLTKMRQEFLQGGKFAVTKQKSDSDEYEDLGPPKESEPATVWADFCACT